MGQINGSHGATPEKPLDFIRTDMPPELEERLTGRWLPCLLSPLSGGKVSELGEQFSVARGLLRHELFLGFRGKLPGSRKNLPTPMPSLRIAGHENSINTADRKKSAGMGGRTPFKE